MLADVASVIVCDDARKEDNGKDFLIGVYSGTLNVQAYPANLPLTLWIEIEPHAIGSLEGRLKIETPSGNQPLELEMTLEVQEEGPAIVIVGGVPMHLEHDGEIIVHAAFGATEMRVVKRKRVRRAARNRD